MYSLINIKFFNSILKKFKKKNKINSDTYISNNRIDSEMKVIDLKPKTKYNSRDRSLDIKRNSNDEYEVILDYQRTNIKRTIKFPDDNDLKKNIKFPTSDDFEVILDYQRTNIKRTIKFSDDNDIKFPTSDDFEDFPNLQIEFLKHSNI
jgi:hypothetical protein